jgi:hypothetical protein
MQPVPSQARHNLNAVAMEEAGMNADLNITTTCRCGQEKRPGAMYCQPCFEALPIRLKQRINRAVKEVATASMLSKEWLERNK